MNWRIESNHIFLGAVWSTLPPHDTTARIKGKMSTTSVSSVCPSLALSPLTNDQYVLMFQTCLSLTYLFPINMQTLLHTEVGP